MQRLKSTGATWTLFLDTGEICNKILVVKKHRSIFSTARASLIAMNCNEDKNEKERKKKEREATHTRNTCMSTNVLTRNTLI
jgi:hypothetical protein